MTLGEEYEHKIFIIYFLYLYSKYFKSKNHNLLQRIYKNLVNKKAQVLPFEMQKKLKCISLKKVSFQDLILFPFRQQILIIKSSIT